MLIEDSNTTDEENRDEDDDVDLYDFSFTNIGTQMITKTQQIALSQKSCGKMNVLSLSDVDEEGFRITLDTMIDKAFTVHDTAIGNIKFNRSKNGLHYYDTRRNNHRTTKFIMTQTVE